MTSHDRVMKMFTGLIKGMNADDLLLLVDETRRSGKVFQWDAPAREVCQPCEEEVPWVLTWLGGRLASKHVMVPRKQPDVRMISQCCSEFASKLIWRWFFRDDDGVCNIKIKRATPTPPSSYNGELSPCELKA